ncbi:MAG: hypothetical protein WC999_05550 [Hydrogenophaga sp.]
MSDHRTRIQADSGLNPLDARVALALAFWAYPHENREKAEKVIFYPKVWEQAIAGKHVPADWPIAQFDAQGKLIRDGWNTQHNAEGRLENQFQISINQRTKQITFDFKGSDAWSNWKSDLGNAGASEFAKIQAKAQAAYEALKNDERYQGFQFAATGHSLGGGMAQSFALRNGIDAYVYNSLPIARDTIRGDYFKGVGGFEAALENYRASGRQVHDVRTPNDIATYAYHGVMRNAYLSERTGQPATMLPGSAVPDLLKTVLLFSEVGTLPVAALMSKDHTLDAVVDAQQGMGIGVDGRYLVPEGQRDFAQIPVEARRRFAMLSGSPVTKAGQIGAADDVSPWNRFLMERADGSRQYLACNPFTGDVEIEHYGPDGQRTRIELNERRRQGATFIEQDAQGRVLHRRQVALHAPTPTPTLGVRQQAQLALAERELADPLRARGLTDAQVAQVCAAAVRHCARHASLGAPDRFLLSRDERQIAVLHGGGIYLSEMPIEAAMRQGAEAHLAEAARLHDVAQVRGSGMAHARMPLV